jgi:CDP-6-deoxy-D-xylo-4-hexulose-3-dehydrase
VPHRVAVDLKNTDFVMNNLFWIGLYPGLSRQMLDYVVETLAGATKGAALPVI